MTDTLGGISEEYRLFVPDFWLSPPPTLLLREEMIEALVSTAIGDRERPRFIFVPVPFP